LIRPLPLEYRARTWIELQDAIAAEAILAHLARSASPAPPGRRPPHSGSPQLRPSLDAAPDTRRRPPPQPHPSARFLTTSPWRRMTARGQRAIARPTSAFAPVNRAVPVSGLGSAGGGRIVRSRVARRGNRGSGVFPSYALSTVTTTAIWAPRVRHASTRCGERARGRGAAALRLIPWPRPDSVANQVVGLWAWQGASTSLLRGELQYEIRRWP